MLTYILRDETGEQTEIEAEDIADAEIEAIDWVRYGDWVGDCTGEENHTVWVRVSIEAPDGTYLGSTMIPIDPEEPDCEEGKDHAWIDYSVRGKGGGVVSVDMCKWCGCRRTEDTWAQDPETGVQGLHSVKYEAGGSW